MTEEWRAVIDYQGKYQVSNLGRVRTIARVVTRRNGVPISIHGRIKQPSRASRGDYPVVCLKDVGKKPKLVTVHSLVAAAFIGPRPKYADICHFDGNPHNSQLSNLRYAFRRENEADKDRHGTRPLGSACHNAKLNADLVRSIRADRSVGLLLRELAAKYQCAEMTIYAVLRGWTWKHVS
jgi:hypothetical protein